MTSRAAPALALLATVTAAPAVGAVPDLPLPSPSTRTAEEVDPLGSVRLPTGPWTDGDLPVVEVEGRVVRRAFTVGSGALTTLQILRPARQALEDAGFETVYACEARVCGGFDFRFALDLIGEPRMHVDLGDYRYHLAQRTSGDGEETVALVASRSAAVGFLHVTTVAPAAAGAPAPDDGEPEAPDVPPDETIPAPDPGALPDLPLPLPPDAPASDAPRTETAPGDLAARLSADGHAVLEGLTFASGSTELGPGGEASLAALAAWMRDRPDARILLVGHTDAIGDLDANRRLSRSRAAAVARALVEAHGVAASRLSSEGAGYLAPRAPNDDVAGRAANRRVEAVVLP